MASLKILPKGLPAYTNAKSWVPFTGTRADPMHALRRASGCSLILCLLWGILAASADPRLLQPVSVDKVVFGDNSVLVTPAMLDFVFIRSILPEQLLFPLMRMVDMNVDPRHRLRFKNSWEDVMRATLQTAGEFVGMFYYPFALLSHYVGIANSLPCQEFFNATFKHLQITMMSQ